MKKICIASDHAGFNLKEEIKSYLTNIEASVIDLGPFNDKSVDYPIYAQKVARRISQKSSNIGILVCGSGTGMSISSNKFKGIRAAVCFNSKSTRLSREHNDANVLCLGSRFIKKNEAVKIVKIFLKTKFEGGRHLRRVKKI